MSKKKGIEALKQEETILIIVCKQCKSKVQFTFQELPNNQLGYCSQCGESYRITIDKQPSIIIRYNYEINTTISLQDVRLISDLLDKRCNSYKQRYTNGWRLAVEFKNLITAIYEWQKEHK